MTGMTGPTSNVSGAELIRALAAGIRPTETGAPQGRTPSNISGAGFASLLSRAAETGTGLPVTIAPDSGIQLSSEQLTRLAAATDAAERQGATRALVLLDGSAYHVDVGVRTVTGKADLSAVNTVTGIDAVVVAQAAPGSCATGPLGAATPETTPGILPVPAATPSSSMSLLKALTQDKAAA